MHFAPIPLALAAALAVASPPLLAAAGVPAPGSAAVAGAGSVHPATLVDREAAADTLRGRVTDVEGAPVEGAEVQIPELQRATRTAGDGSFAFANVPAAGYSLVIRRAGYATEVRRVEAGATSPLQVALKTTPFLVPAVTVTATRSPIVTIRSPLAVAAVGDEQLRRHSEVSLAHTIQELPGVRTLSTGEQIGKPVIRGLTGSRVLVLDAGNRLEDYSWSDEDAPSIDARLADRVEVIRGPASLLYGADAEGGVVNVIPEDVPDPTGGASFLRTAVEAWGASNNRETGGNLRLEGAARGLGYRLAGIGRFAEDLHTPAGPLENTGFWAANGEAAAGKKGSWGSATLRYARYGGEFRLLEANGPPPGQSSGGGEEGPVRKLADDRVQFQGDFPAGGALGL
ncbi:MAG TPA: TonB-dependent receptor plug domain-containing protein, partial [Longimicrobiales bacterium]